MTTVFQKVKYGYRKTLTGAPQGGAGAYLAGTDPQVVGSELERIRNANGGKLFPPDVIDEAKREKSLLHTCFEWDDEIAGRKFRLQQARGLIKVIFIESIESKPLETPISAFVHISEQVETKNEDRPTEIKQVRYYDNTIEAMQVPEKREYILAKALRELESWQDRYDAYREFSLVFSAIESTKRKLAPVLE